jgi:hypothetical protein
MDKLLSNNRNYINSKYYINCSGHSSLASKSEGKFLVTLFEFGGSLSMSLEGDCHEVEVTPNLESLTLTTFGMSLDRVCNELYTQFHCKLIPNLEVTKNSLKKAPS